MHSASDDERGVGDEVTPQPEPHRARHWTDKLVGRSPESWAAAVYGTIICAAVIATSEHEPSLGAVALAVVVTVLVYWLAERYAAYVGATLHHGRQQTAREVFRALVESWPMVQSSYAPLLILLLCYLAGASVDTAVTIALGFSVALLTFLGWLVGRRADLTGARIVVAAAVNGFFGLILVALKIALH
jgi:hypothetical protein